MVAGRCASRHATSGSERVKILVIGATGQLAQELAAADTDGLCTFLGRDQLDLASVSKIEPTLGAHDYDLLVNAAAYTAVDKAEEEEGLATVINGAAPTEMARVSAAKGAAIVHVSTDYVFDGDKPSPYLPDDATGPIGGYGRSKLAGEMGVAAQNPRHMILRTAWVYSKFGNNFVKTMLRVGATRDSLNVVNDQFGCPTHAADLAEAILFMADALTTADTDAPIWGLHHFAGDGITSWADFATEIFAQAKELGLIENAPHVHGIPATDYPTPAKRPHNSALDCSSFDQVSGYIRPKWQGSLAHMLRGLKEMEDQA